MKLLNLGCGGVRPPEPFLNVDTLLAQHRFFSPECDQLRAEENYVEYNVLSTPWPWLAGTFDGILASHVLEHFTAIEARDVLRQCHEVLTPGGILRVSVPDASCFRANYHQDCRENAERLYGEPIWNPDKSTMLDYALYFEGHKQTFCEDSLWCLLANGGFTPARIYRVGQGETMLPATETGRMLAEHDNRASFSLYLEAWKQEAEA